MLAGVCAVVLSMMLYACDDELNVKQDYDFSFSSWYLPSAIKADEEVEIRLTLDREGDYRPAEYYIGYIQLEGKGQVHDRNGNILVTREIYPLNRISGLNRDHPTRQVFTLWYKNLADEPSQIKFIIEDSFGRQRELILGFQTES